MPRFSDQGANFFALCVFVAAIATIPLAVPGASPFSFSLEGKALFHTTTEAVDLALVAAMFCVSWFAPRDRYRLRPTLIACLCAPLLVFTLIHVLAYPGMPVWAYQDVSSNAEFYFARLAHLLFPLMLIVLGLVSGTSVLPARLRWSLFGVTVACALPTIWYFLFYAGKPSALGANLFIVVNVGFHLLAAFVVSPLRGNGHPEVPYGLFAALGGALREGLELPLLGGSGMFTALSHSIGPAAVAAGFAAVYGDAVGAPYNWLERARRTALVEKDRLESAFRSISDGVILVDQSFMIKAMNPVARHLLCGRNRECAGQLLPPLLEALDMGSARSILADIRRTFVDGRLRTASEGAVTWQVAGASAVIEYAVSPSFDQSSMVQGVVLIVRDVTERARLQENLRSAAGYARSLIEASPDPMIAIDLDGRIADVNSATEIAIGIERTHLIGTRFAAYFLNREAATQALQDAIPNGVIRDVPLLLRRSDGTTTEVSCNVSPYRGEDGKVLGVFAIARDVTEMRRVQEQLQFQATRDPLTALPNRRLFRERIECGMGRAAGERRHLAVLLIDVDDFKDVNDTRGHSVGDDLLKGIGDRLVGALRSSDTVARIGGDEFGVLIEDISGRPDALPYAEALLSAVTAPMYLDGFEVNVSCSIGVSIFPDDADDADVLLRNADTAMYRAKELGKNNFQLFTPDMNTAVQRRVELGSRLRTALDRSELSIRYQPQVDLETSKVTGVEALLRWNSPELGSVSPMEFIPVAEDTGAILPIGSWVLEEACRQAMSWYKQFGFYISVAINLSARQFRENDIVAEVEHALVSTGLPSALLELELTESLLVRDPARVAEILRSLKQLGVTIAIDDFGTGYSSLSYLKQFPLDYLKIDRSFVNDLPGDRNDEAIVKSIIALSHSLGLKVIAEGVETREQVSFLRELGCNEIQGYYVSRPVEVGELYEFLGSSQEFAPAFPTHCLNQ